MAKFLKKRSASNQGARYDSSNGAEVVQSSPVLANAGLLGLEVAMTEKYIEDRSDCDPSESFTAFMDKSGSSEMVRALAADSVRFVEDVAAGTSGETVVYRAADVIYMIMMILRKHKCTMRDALEEIIDRIIETNYHAATFRDLKSSRLQASNAEAYLLGRTSAYAGTNMSNGSKKSMERPVKLSASHKKAVAKKALPKVAPSKLKKASVVKLNKPGKLLSKIKRLAANG